MVSRSELILFAVSVMVILQGCRPHAAPNSQGKNGRGKGAEINSPGVTEVITKTVIARTTEENNQGQHKPSGSDGSDYQNCDHSNQRKIRGAETASLGVTGMITKTAITRTTQEKTGGVGQKQTLWE